MLGWLEGKKWRPGGLVDPQGVAQVKSVEGSDFGFRRSREMELADFLR